MQRQLSPIYRSTPTSYSQYIIAQITFEQSIQKLFFERIKSHVGFLFVFFRSLSAENPDLVQLKSLLAGLTLPVKSSSAEVAAEERDGNHCFHFGIIMATFYFKSQVSLLTKYDICIHHTLN